MTNSMEAGPERILTKDEVLTFIATRMNDPVARKVSAEHRVYLLENAGKAELVRELSDEQGLYLLEAQIPGSQPGEVIQYEYMRKGRFPNNNEAAESAVYLVYYENDIPVGGQKIAVFDSVTGDWKNAE